MASYIARRRFLATLGGAAAAWPLAARAQQPGKTPRVGYIRAGTANNDPYRELFVRGMRDLGYVEGRNIVLEFRHYGDDVGSIGSLISDLLRAKVDIIVAGGTPAVRAAQAVTQKIPIVMIAATQAGCLFSYSVSIKDMWYRSATYIDKIIKGAKPSDLPVQQGTKFEWVINLKTARALGLDVSPTLLARADEVIE
jgi:ABC-type uncharacterized transport system substrate-binding protein